MLFESLLLLTPDDPLFELSLLFVELLFVLLELLLLLLLLLSVVLLLLLLLLLLFVLLEELLLELLLLLLLLLVLLLVLLFLLLFEFTLLLLFSITFCDTFCFVSWDTWAPTVENALLSESITSLYSFCLSNITFLLSLISDCNSSRSFFVLSTLFLSFLSSSLKVNYLITSLILLITSSFIFVTAELYSFLTFSLLSLFTSCL